MNRQTVFYLWPNYVFQPSATRPFVWQSDQQGLHCTHEVPWGKEMPLLPNHCKMPLWTRQSLHEKGHPKAETGGETAAESLLWMTSTTQWEEPRAESYIASLFRPATTIPECRATQSYERRSLGRRRNKWKVDMKVEAQDTSAGSQAPLAAHGFMSRLWELIVAHHTTSTEGFTGALRTWETTGPTIVRHLVMLLQWICFHY